MKISHLVSSILLLISTSAFADTSGYQENCDRLAAKFGTQKLSYSYTNFQGLAAESSANYQITAKDCKSDQAGHTVTVSNAKYPDINMQLIGEADGNGVISYRTTNLGSCPSVVSSRYLDFLRQNNVAVVEATIIAVRNSYDNSACPALRDVLAATLKATYDAVTQDILAESN